MSYLDRISYTKLATNAGKDLWYKTTWKHESEAVNHEEYEMYSRTKRSSLAKGNWGKCLRKTWANGVDTSTHFLKPND